MKKELPATPDGVHHLQAKQMKRKQLLMLRWIRHLMVTNFYFDTALLGS